MFTSPIYYASYFAESWMFQYLSNLTEWGFGLLTEPALIDLYNTHIQVLWFGTNFWFVLFLFLLLLLLLFIIIYYYLLLFIITYYLSNLTEWGFGLLTEPALIDLYNTHIQVLWFGTNFWFVLLLL